MATINVKLQDGSIQPMSYPDDWSDSQVQEAIYKHFPPQSKQGAEEPKDSALDKVLRYGVKDPIIGLANLGHGILNAPHNLAALLSDKLASHIPKQEDYDYSTLMGIPSETRNLADKLIQFTPELGVSVALPETKLGAIGKGIEMIPRAGKYLKTALGNALSQGLFAASQSDENQGKAALTAGGIAAPFSAAAQGILSGDPKLRALSRALMGAGAGTLGYQGAKALGGGDVTSDLVGALMGIAGYRGVNPRRLAAESMLKGVDGSNFQPALDAAERLNLKYITPAEATGNPFVGAAQGNIGKTEEGAQALYKAGQARTLSEKDAIQNLMNTITPANNIAAQDVRGALQSQQAKLEKDRLAASNPLYEKAHAKSVAPSWVTNLENSDPTIKNAIQSAMSDPKYQVEGELLGLPKNSIKVLDYAKRKIDSQIEQAINYGDNDAVRVLTNSKNKLLNKISSVDKDFKSARDTYSQYSKPIDEFLSSQRGQLANTKDTNLKNVSSKIFDPNQTNIDVLLRIKDDVQRNNPGAWNSIIKNEMQRLMSKKADATEGVGSKFYNNILKDENRFNQFKAALSDNPKALQQLDDMKAIFGRLINIPTAKSAEALSRGSMSKDRASSATALRMLQEILSGNKYDKYAVELITNPKWKDELAKIKNISNTDKFIGRASQLMGSAGAQSIAQ